MLPGLKPGDEPPHRHDHERQDRVIRLDLSADLLLQGQPVGPQQSCCKAIGSLCKSRRLVRVLRAAPRDRAVTPEPLNGIRQGSHGRFIVRLQLHECVAPTVNEHRGILDLEVVHGLIHHQGALSQAPVVHNVEHCDEELPALALRLLLLLLRAIVRSGIEVVHHDGRHGFWVNRVSVPLVGFCPGLDLECRLGTMP